MVPFKNKHNKPLQCPSANIIFPGSCKKTLNGISNCHNYMFSIPLVKDAANQVALFFIPLIKDATNQVAHIYIYMYIYIYKSICAFIKIYTSIYL